MGAQTQPKTVGWGTIPAHDLGALGWGQSPAPHGSPGTLPGCCSTGGCPQLQRPAGGTPGSGTSKGRGFRAERRGFGCGSSEGRGGAARGRRELEQISGVSWGGRTPLGRPEGRVGSLQGFCGCWKIREAFKVFDRDGNGFISKQELGTAMRSLGYMPNEVELEVIIQRLDMDGDGQVDFEEFVTLLGPKLSTSGIPEKFHGTDFDTVFWKCDMQKLTVDELKRLLYDTFCEHLSMKDIENIIMTEEESHMGTAEELHGDQQIRQTCVRKSLICAFAIAFIISVMLIAANQVLRSGMK
uniref:Calcium binding protein 7 n=1 Tax=Zosterops lateralis melanops TaxID=1220523 RepID=A0A8D2PCI9_ZOSLA